MLYTASYFEPLCHHGRLISISRSIPRGFRVDGTVEFFVPSREILMKWKSREIDEEGYKALYRSQLKDSWSYVKAWVTALDFLENQTLLCWERSGQFCHRNFVATIVEHFRPDIFGGRDVLYLTPEPCPRCSGETVSTGWGLWCPSCEMTTSGESSDSSPVTKGDEEEVYPLDRVSPL